jgi:hypothetical protein
MFLPCFKPLAALLADIPCPIGPEWTCSPVIRCRSFHAVRRALKARVFPCSLSVWISGTRHLAHQTAACSPCATHCSPAAPGKPGCQGYVSEPDEKEYRCRPRMFLSLPFPRGAEKMVIPEPGQRLRPLQRDETRPGSGKRRKREAPWPENPWRGKRATERVP